MKAVHIDFGSEFRRARDWLARNGVDIFVTADFTPESNGLPERTHSVVMSLARACLQNAKLGECLWYLAIRYVVLARNIVKLSMTGAVDSLWN